ncbi:MAG: AmmeMemoRadiSam system protein B [Deltaproteobacteria bacterium]|nr:AmmeMemoRadiSam system protein B [Deltaproteobacteria bacterium]
MQPKITIFFFLALLFCIIGAMLPSPLAADKADIHHSVIAGTWYPGDRHQLSATIQKYLSCSRKVPLGGTPRALIVPHAGYRYSGAVAAHAYRQLKGSGFSRIILVGPSHYLAFDGVSVNLQSAYETPLGSVPVDLDLARKIISARPDFRWIRQAHAREHALEIQLPFLQTVLGNFQIIPIVIGRQDYATAERLARILAALIRGRRDTLLLASSDLSHYHSSQQARMLDACFASHVLALDAKGLARDLAAGKTEACGGGPVMTVLLAAKRLGATKAIILGQANSGDVTGDQGRVVGYLSAVLIAPFPK